MDCITLRRIGFLRLYVLISAVLLGTSADSKRYVRFMERTINEFKRYSDMEVMVITVPDVTKSMDVFVDFEAIHTSSCRTLSIEVYYQYGAPPLPPMQTFSNKTFLKRTCAGSEARTLDNKKPLTVKGILPGLWYIGVLVPLSNGVKRISDLGFGNLTTHGCSFNVTTSATLTVASTADFIPSDGEKIRGYLPDDLQTRYYRYQHVTKSSSLTVSISGCYLIKDDGEQVTDVCPLTLAISRKSLPSKDSPSVDCFSKNPCEISIATPEQEQTDYYVSTARIPHLAGGSVHFNISVYTNECYDTKSSNLMTSLYPGCVAVQKMFSVTAGKVLNKIFYPNLWNSSILLHSTGDPRFYSLPIPSSHVGSVLTVRASYIPSGHSGRGVALCLQKDFPAGFFRDYYDHDFRMNCSGIQSFMDESRGSVNTEMVVPFPEAGTWYISVYQFRFYDYATYNIRLNAEIQGCIDNCNDHGTCYITTKPDLVYGTCTCNTGFTGWACEKEVDLDLVAVCLLCLSNIAFVVDVVIAARMKLFPEMVVYMFLTIMSTLFHLCKTQVSCVMDVSFLQLCDFYAISLSLWVTLVAMTSLSNASYTATLNMIAVLVLFVSVVKARDSVIPFVLTIVIGLTIPVVYHIVMWCRGKPAASFRKKRWALFILPASILVTLCVLIFALFETADQYKYIHSIGQVLLGIGIALLLPNHRHRVGHYDVSRQLTADQPINSRTPLLIGHVRHV